VSRILFSLISNQLGKVTSLTGEGKCATRGLQNSDIQQLLYRKLQFAYYSMLYTKLFTQCFFIESVRNNTGYENLTDFEIDSHTKKWLKNCKDREGGREIRKNRQCSTVSNLAEPKDAGD